MGMGTAPCCGYILKATEENCKAVGLTYSTFDEDLQEHISEGGDYMSFLWDCSYEDVYFATRFSDKECVSFYIHGDGDRYDGLEDGEGYLLFSDDALFVTTPMPLMNALRVNKIEPQFELWTQYG